MGGRQLKKVIYLNYDLSKQEELQCYQFLESLGRSKKSFINTLLRSSGLLRNYPQQYIVIEKTKQGNEKQKKRVQVEETQGINSQQVAVQIEKSMPIAALTLAAEESKDMALFSQKQKDNMIALNQQRYAVFTLEQQKEIERLGLDIDSLSDIQWKDMVDSVNDGVSLKVAFRSAQFIS